MESDYRRAGWVAALAAVLLAAFVGYFAYSAGVSQGVVAGQQISAGGAAAPAVVPPAAPYYWYGYGWHRPWGFGFFPFFFMLFFFLWFVRALAWGGSWRRHRYYGCGYYSDLPPAFDDWHRRAHERMTKEPGAPPTDDDRSRR
jgi:hypothetical protein